MSTSPRARTIAREIARRMEINNGDMLLIKKTDMYDDIKIFNQIRLALHKVGKENIVVVIVDEFDDIASWGEEKLKEYGWCKCEAE